MPKKMNCKRQASAHVRLADTLDAAVSGKYEIALIKGKLGFKGFRADVFGRSTTQRHVFITSKVVSAQGRAEIGTFLIVLDSEVQAIITRQEQVDALRAAGRIPEEVSGLAEFYDMEEAEEELETWEDRKSQARTLAERERMAGEEKRAAEMAGRIRRRRAGLLDSAKRDAALAAAAALAAERRLAALEEEVAADPAPAAEEEAAEAPSAEQAEEEAAPTHSADGKPLNRAERRAALRAAQEEAAAAAAEAARLAALYAAAEEEDRRREEEERETQAFLAAQRSRVVATTWEEELDVEAI
jgi:hypothetical protein